MSSNNTTAASTAATGTVYANSKMDSGAGAGAGAGTGTDAGAASTAATGTVYANSNTSIANPSSDETPPVDGEMEDLEGEFVDLLVENYRLPSVYLSENNNIDILDDLKNKRWAVNTLTKPQRMVMWITEYMLYFPKKWHNMSKYRLALIFAFMGWFIYQFVQGAIPPVDSFPILITHILGWISILFVILLVSNNNYGRFIINDSAE